MAPSASATACAQRGARAADDDAPLCCNSCRRTMVSAGHGRGVNTSSRAGCDLPAITRPSATSATCTAQSSRPSRNSRVPSSGSMIQTRWACKVADRRQILPTAPRHRTDVPVPVRRATGRSPERPQHRQRPRVHRIEPQAPHAASQQRAGAQARSRARQRRLRWRASKSRQPERAACDGAVNLIKKPI